MVDYRFSYRKSLEKHLFAFFIPTNSHGTPHPSLAVVGLKVKKPIRNTDGCFFCCYYLLYYYFFFICCTVGQDESLHDFWLNKGLLLLAHSTSIFFLHIILYINILLYTYNIYLPKEFQFNVRTIIFITLYLCTVIATSH